MFNYILKITTLLILLYDYILINSMYSLFYFLINWIIFSTYFDCYVINSILIYHTIFFMDQSYWGVLDIIMNSLIMESPFSLGLPSLSYIWSFSIYFAYLFLNSMFLRIGKIRVIVRLLQNFRFSCDLPGYKKMVGLDKKLINQIQPSWDSHHFEEDRLSNKILFSTLLINSQVFGASFHK